MDTTSFNSKVNISPNSEFTTGTGVNVQLTVGNDFSTISSTLPSHLIENPASFGVELQVKSADQAAQVVEVLGQVKEMIGQMVPNVEEYYKQGVAVNFRNTGTSVFVDVSLGGAFGEMITGVLSKYNFNSVDFAGGSKLGVSSKLSPVDVLSFNGEQLIEELSNLKFEFNGEFSHLKNIVNFAIDTLTSISGGSIPNKLKPAIYALKVAEVIRKLDFTFQYDSSVVQEIIKDTINSGSSGTGENSKYAKVSEDWTKERQPALNETVNQFAAMGGVFLEPYKPALLNLNLDTISVYGVSPNVRAYAKVSVDIRGASDFVAKILG